MMRSTLFNADGAGVAVGGIGVLVGAGGTVQYFNGSVWFMMPTPVATNLRAMYGTAQQNAYVVGDNGVVLWGTGA